MSDGPRGPERQERWRRMCKCSVWKCPLCQQLHNLWRRCVLCRLIRRILRLDQDCFICRQQVPKASLMPCSRCGNVSCALCHLRIVKAQNAPSPEAVTDACCGFCRHPFTHAKLLYLDAIYLGHQDEIGFKLWDPEGGSATFSSISSLGSMFTVDSSWVSITGFRSVASEESTLAEELPFPSFISPSVFVRPRPLDTGVIRVVGGTVSTPSLYEEPDERMSLSQMSVVRPIQISPS